MKSFAFASVATAGAMHLVAAQDQQSTAQPLGFTMADLEAKKVCPVGTVSTRVDPSQIQQNNMIALHEQEEEMQLANPSAAGGEDKDDGLAEACVGADWQTATSMYQTCVTLLAAQLNSDTKTLMDKEEKGEKLSDDEMKGFQNSLSDHLKDDAKDIENPICGELIKTISQPLGSCMNQSFTVVHTVLAKVVQSVSEAGGIAALQATAQQLAQSGEAQSEEMAQQTAMIALLDGESTTVSTATTQDGKMTAQERSQQMQTFMGQCGLMAAQLGVQEGTCDQCTSMHDKIQQFFTSPDFGKVDGKQVGNVQPLSEDDAHSMATALTGELLAVHVQYESEQAEKMLLQQEYKDQQDKNKCCGCWIGVWVAIGIIAAILICIVLFLVVCVVAKRNKKQLRHRGSLDHEGEEAFGNSSRHNVDYQSSRSFVGGNCEKDETLMEGDHNAARDMFAFQHQNGDIESSSSDIESGEDNASPAVLCKDPVDEKDIYAVGPMRM